MYHQISPKDQRHAKYCNDKKSMNIFHDLKQCIGSPRKYFLHQIGTIRGDEFEHLAYWSYGNFAMGCLNTFQIYGY